MAYRWVPILGPVKETSPTSIAFTGDTVSYVDPLSGQTHEDGGLVGQALSDAEFNGGTIRALIRFKSIQSKMAAGLTLAANPTTGAHLTAMLGLGPFCSLRAWNPGDSQQLGGAQTARWIDYQGAGNQSNLQADHDYALEVELHGARIVVRVDGVPMLDADIRETLTKFRPGVWFLSQGDVEITNFEVVSKVPTAFVVMEFSETFNDLYTHVIKPVCEKSQISTIRADERHGPGQILADIERQIVESNIIVADVTPVNANVFYEVGYAHALRKPTILLAQRGTRLPFDISGFRTIFYDNTIEGKLKVEDSLEKHLKQILSRDK
ncbi:hypothetical protein VOI32_28725 [Paraburkholderia caribensis]|nr:hypothetical protein [Paraburkholderia caribensis]MCO4880518.1 nucleoside 2-deoxyribosyltransferase [Paraburkholderia caribensis]PTB23786.1 hypothetical protein C9I56_37440 [Paraburkholderia caribensis]